MTRFLPISLSLAAIAVCGGGYAQADEPAAPAPAARPACELPPKAAPAGPANRSNLIAMAARPEDLCRGRGSGDAPGAPQALQVGRYMTPEAPAAPGAAGMAAGRSGEAARR